MKALTLLPHYAAFIAGGVKQIETRPKSVGTKFRGDLVIHAGVTWKMKHHFQWRGLCDQFPEINQLFSFSVPGARYTREPRMGAGLCVVTVVDIVPVTDVFDTLTPLEIAVGDYSLGINNPRYAWKLENVRPFDTPIPAKGQLGLWTWKA
jgi:hypothetical protein